MLRAHWARARVTQHGQPNARTGSPKPQDTLQAPTKGIRPQKPCPQFHHSTKITRTVPKTKSPKGFIPPPSILPSLHPFPSHSQMLAQPHHYPEPKKRDKKRDI